VKVEAVYVLIFTLAATDNPLAVFVSSTYRRAGLFANCDKNASHLKNGSFLVEIFSKKASRGPI